MASGLRHIATEPGNLNHRLEVPNSGAGSSGTTMSGLTPDGSVPNSNSNVGNSHGHSYLKRSPLLRNKKKSVAGTASDSDGSVDSNSLSADSNAEVAYKNSPKGVPVVQAKKIRQRRGSEWEILEGLKDGQRFDRKPPVFTGYLHKKRKWPLKGWHKRYFLVDKGILIYAKSPVAVARGKLHGSVDIGLSVISTKSKRRRLDIDAEEFIYHLKAKTHETFVKWVDQLKVHRLYRQHVLTFGSSSREGTLTFSAGHSSPAQPKIPLTPPEREARDGSLPRGVKLCSSPPSNVLLPGSSGRISNWVVDAQSTLESLSRELSQAGQTITQLNRLLEQIETIPTLDVEPIPVEGSSPNVKKDRKKFGLRKKKSSKGSSMDLSAVGFSPSKSNIESESASPLSTGSFSGLSTSPGGLMAQNRLSSSNSSLTIATQGMANSLNANVATRPQSLPGAEHLLPLASLPCDNNRLSSFTPDNHLREDFVILAKDVQNILSNVLSTLSTERDRLKVALEFDNSTLSGVGLNTSSVGGLSALPGLRASLNQALQQNQDLRTRLARIHEAADLSDVSAPPKPIHASLSYSSSCVSASEFFDAEEHHENSVASPTEERVGDISGIVQRSEGENENELDGEPGAISDTSSEAGSLTSEEGSASSENSEMATEEFNAVENAGGGESLCLTGRRTKLPAPRPDSEGLSLWNLLCKNIGKDLSQISMPVALNEPLNMLQRLCEELEYSELLDKAAEINDPLERMVCIAAFTVSSYGSSYFRAGSKPFNPLLGETYECVREDKGFRFIAEQVSHHPPISVCYAESRNYIFWQDARIKTKFWGKSMEFQPTGVVNLQLPRTGDVYQWNKVTTCVHNLFSGQRWVDQYGELRITCNSGISCKLTFAKASYWSAKRHEVYGQVYDENGKEVRKLFGKWSEALYCGVAPAAKCIWRRGTMPDDYERYYGFTRFAIELNELDPEMAKYLPCTDTRFRKDQRMLEEGNLDAAEQIKMDLEQAQRERRKTMELEGVKHEPRWFTRKTLSNGEEIWENNHKYWECRKSPGFMNMGITPLW